MKRFTSLALSLLLIFSLLSGCGRAAAAPETVPAALPSVPESSAEVQAAFTYDLVPAYDGAPFAVIHNNVPYLDPAEFPQKAFERYAPLDRLGRCGDAVAAVGLETMPTEERGSIGMVKPTGWHTVKYDFVDGKYLYNRCHLIGWQLTGENANESNLITGTRYLNIEGMLPFENMIADFVKETEYHVLYRVTPVFVDDELLARGVLMEAMSLEDQGEGIQFCVFAYNVQPGAVLNYQDGSSTEDRKALPAQEETAADYILNTNSKKFHRPSCGSAQDISPKNRQEYTGSRQDLIDQGYSPCKRCNP